MNDQLTNETLMQLSQAADSHSISLYMPAHRIGTEAQQDPIRLRNLLDEAHAKLEQAGLDRRTIEMRLAEARALQDDREFWRKQSDGLALFIGPDATRIYRLPLELDELVILADSFHTKPLLPLLANAGHFYLLALSQNEVRFFQATRDTIDEVELEDVPTSLEAALAFDDPESQLQFHTGTGRQDDGERGAMYHGHGVGVDDNKDDLTRFFRQVDKGLADRLQEQQAPLVLAGVDYLLPLYKEVSDYKHFTPRGIEGNVEKLSAAELHARAWEIVEPIFQASLDDALADYATRAAQDMASAELDAVLEAAHSGRVEIAFVALDEQLWGAFDPATFTTRQDDAATADNVDLIDLAARQTLLHGGMVYALARDEMPDNSFVAALFRY